MSPTTAPDAHAPVRVVVVGAGIAGLAAAARVRELRPEAEVLVLEAASTIGGKLRLGEVAGVGVDLGAESMLARRPEAVALAVASGLAADVVHPATTKANLWNRGRLTPMPRTLMGVPVDLRALDGVLSRGGLARAAMDAVLPATRLDGADVSVGSLVAERFGSEVVDRLVEPLLGGVYAGHSRELSARATVPQVVALLDQDRSMLRAAAAVTAVAGATAAPTATGAPAAEGAGPTPVFAGLRGGVGRLPGAVVAAYDLDVRTGATVRDVARREGGGFHLVVGSTADPVVVTCDAVVLATPAAATARLLSDLAPHAALELARVEHASMAVVTLALPAQGLPELVGSGFLVPPVEGRRIKAATFSHHKWAWVAQAAHDAGGEVVVLRCSLGRHREEQVLQASDEDLVDLVVADLTEALGLTARPVDAHVQRWGGALPQYAVGHLDRVAAVRADVARVPGLAVCGAAYDGLGVPACIASAHRAVDAALEGLVGALRPGGSMEP